MPVPGGPSNTYTPPPLAATCLHASPQAPCLSPWCIAAREQKHAMSRYIQAARPVCYAHALFPCEGCDGVVQSLVPPRENDVVLHFPPQVIHTSHDAPVNAGLACEPWSGAVHKPDPRTAQQSTAQHSKAQQRGHMLGGNVSTTFRVGGAHNMRGARWGTRSTSCHVISRTQSRPCSSVQTQQHAP